MYINFAKIKQANNSATATKAINGKQIIHPHTDKNTHTSVGNRHANKQ